VTVGKVSWKVSVGETVIVGVDVGEGVKVEVEPGCPPLIWNPVDAKGLLSLMQPTTPPKPIKKTNPAVVAHSFFKSSSLKEPSPKVKTIGEHEMVKALGKPLIVERCE